MLKKPTLPNYSHRQGGVRTNNDRALVQDLRARLALVQFRDLKSAGVSLI